MSSESALEWPASRVRQVFLEYFQEREHQHWAPSPVVPVNDPTLLFTNSGMVQFKPIFLGTVDPSNPMSALQRACNVQPCIRAGGKHNDLDEVGKDCYHHCCFGMMGNWSFNSSYFKKEAIEWAWELLTVVYGLSPDRLYATYFGGDDAMGVAADSEARALWLQFLPESHVLPFSRKDNFWEMGDVGPCGPCTEIHYDRIGGRDASAMVNRDDPDVIEIWNLVFMQYSREPDSSLRPLPAKHVDTGMGFERLVSVLQDKRSNYDTDIFTPILDAIQQVTGARAYGGAVGAADTDRVDMAYRVVADHIRTLCVAIADGSLPSNEGRGYVLRRILRRAVRYGQQMLNAPRGFFSGLVPMVAAHMRDWLPGILDKAAFVQEVLAEEEASFNRTLSKGLRLFQAEADALAARGEAVVPGKTAFFLYDTMGFPADLTQLMAEERGLTVDMAGYRAAMEEARQVSKAAHRAARGGRGLVLEAEQTAHLARAGVAATEDAPKFTWHHRPEARVMAIFTRDGFVEEVAAPPAAAAAVAEGAAEAETEEAAAAVVGVVLDRTSFYAEAGGQLFDTGALKAATGALFDVFNVQSFGGFVLHMGAVSAERAPGVLRVGDTVKCCVDYERRARIAPNHTMTHVLNFALREVLGEGADQKGSLVTDEKLRFDFSSTRGLAPEHLARVEAIVNERIDAALAVHTKVVPLADAQRIHSLRAVFGEVYPDPVRVVAVGKAVEELLADPENAAWGALSVEFCGGTHLSNTAHAKKFALIEEGSIAKGIRRVVALTGDAAYEAFARGEELRARVAEARGLRGEALNAALGAVKQEVDAAVISAAVKAQVREEVRALEKEYMRQKKAEAAAAADAAMASATAEAEAVAAAQGEEAQVVVARMDAVRDANVAAKVVEALHARCPRASVLLVSVDAAAPAVAVYAAVTDAHVEAGLKAGDWAKAALERCGGRGGGRPTFAQGRGADVAQADAALEAAREFAARFA